MSHADPFLTGGDTLPALTDDERAALVKVGRAGGSLPRRELDLAAARRLLDVDLLTRIGPVAVGLTVRGIEVLAEMAGRDA